MTIGGEDRRAHWVTAFAEAKPSELALLVDSYGMCALAFDQRSAAAELEAAGGQDAHAGRPDRRGAPMRWGTSLVLVVLLVLILVAALTQFVFHLG